jgi:hypothetical protein
MKSTIPLTPVSSSQIHSIGFDPASNTLAICFPRKGPEGVEPGSVYEYRNVEQATFDAFLASESKNKFFGEHIKPNGEKFPFTKMVPDEEEKQAA